VQTVLPPPSLTVIVSPLVPVPMIGGMFVVTVVPLPGEVITGAGIGAIVSTVMCTMFDCPLMVPPGGVWVADNECGPSLSGAVGVHEYVPPLPTVAVQIGVVPSLTVTMAPGVPLPEIGGRLLLVTVLSTGDVIVGAAVVGGVI